MNNNFGQRQATDGELCTCGRQAVTVFESPDHGEVGYGACGKGVAANFRNAHAIVSVVERDPVLRLQAMLDGYLVPDREDALRTADVVITVTGAQGVVTAADEPLLKDGAILANGGHFPWEIEGIASEPRIIDLSDSAVGHNHIDAATRVTRIAERRKAVAIDHCRTKSVGTDFSRTYRLARIRRS